MFCKDFICTNIQTGPRIPRMTTPILPLVSLLLLVCHVAATFYMVGLVWFVQRVHYPLFASVGADATASWSARGALSAEAPCVPRARSRPACP